jgi:prepilin-type processing-associated H-X9-DG protein
MLEILVVIGIIAILMALLLSAISRTVELSRRVQCLSNLRQIGIGLSAYAVAFNGLLPNDNPSEVWSNSTSGDSCMPILARDYVGSRLPGNVAGVPAVFHCPSDVDPIPGDITTAEYDEPNSARVSYDFYSLWWAPEYGPKLAALRGMAPLAWDLDGGNSTPSPDQNHGTLGGNVLLADGHAEWQPAGQWDSENWPHPAQQFYPDQNPTDAGN